MTSAETVLASSLGEAMDREFDAYLSEAAVEPHSFSRRFERRLGRLLRSGRPAVPVRRVLIAAAAAVLALVALACASPNLRRTLAGFWIKAFKDHDEYIFSDVTKKSIEEVYALSPVPEGFEETYFSQNDVSCFTDYYDANGNLICLKQYSANPSGQSADNQQGEAMEEAVGGLTVYLRISEGYASASWVDNGYFFSLTCTPSVSFDRLRELIMSVGIRPEPAH